MNFLVDESVDAPIARVLREKGHRATCVWELSPGISDEDVLTLANRDAVFRLGHAQHGVLLVRLLGLSPQLKADIVSQAVLEHGDEMPSAFTVLTAGLIRIRKMAGPKDNVAR